MTVAGLNRYATVTILLLELLYCYYKIYYNVIWSIDIKDKSKTEIQLLSYYPKSGQTTMKHKIKEDIKASEVLRDERGIGENCVKNQGLGSC